MPRQYKQIHFVLGKIDVYTYYIPIGSRHFFHFVTHFAALSVTDTKQMVNIWNSRFEDLSLNCDLG